MGGACSTYGGIGEVRTGFWLGNLRERGHLEDVGLDGRIFKWLIKKYAGWGVDWISRTLVNTVMKLRVA
jgi:hypothetical protein